jgi:hypothetical protein
VLVLTSRRWTKSIKIAPSNIGVMNERGRGFEPQPSERNGSSGAVNLFDMTFSQVGESRFGGSNYMRARRRF